jgi:NACHT domain
MTPQRGRFAFVVALLTVVAMAAPTAAYTATPVRQSTETEAIEALATRDVKAGAPLQTSLALQLFARAPYQMSAVVVAGIYERAYLSAQHQRAASGRSLWGRWKSNLGWLAAVLAILALAFQKALGAWLGTGLSSAGNWMYGRFAGRRSFRVLAVRRYRKALVNATDRVVIPFRRNRPLSMAEIFVPLILQGPDASTLDLRQAVIKFKRVLILGPPGSGKSMLLKRIAFDYGRGRSSSIGLGKVPCLVELHRLSERAGTLEDEIVASFSRMGFPNAAGFVSRGLGAGSIFLLLDALDEVSSNARKHVAREITELLQAHKSTGAIITCRRAVYMDDLDEVTDGQLEVGELLDSQIYTFLEAWREELPPTKSPEHLMRTLHDHPRMMAIARNPLMLTIIAHLYADIAEYVLPNSRAEFYREAAEVLLQQWHRDQNSYENRIKRHVLGRVALAGQTAGDEAEGDRRTITSADVLAVTREVLPALGLAEADAPGVLAEIVERSGLLLLIDGGERYQFGHLTWQEYFAASEREDRQADLLKELDNNPTAWREVVKLWCGIVRDSTTMVREVQTRDRLLALECLADAARVDDGLAQEIIDESVEMIVAGAQPQTDFELALGSVAADRGPRGVSLIRRLGDELHSAPGDEIAIIARVLAYSNASGAASALVTDYGRHPEVRVALVRMGDLAVPALVSAAKDGVYTALDDLAEIATPKAIAGISDVVNNGSPEAARAAAWRATTFLGSSGLQCATAREGQDRDFVWLGKCWVLCTQDDSMYDPGAERLVARLGRLLCESTGTEVPVAPRLHGAIGAPLLSTQSNAVATCSRAEITKDLVDAANTVAGRSMFLLKDGELIVSVAQRRRQAMIQLGVREIERRGRAKLMEALWNELMSVDGRDDADLEADIDHFIDKYIGAHETNAVTASIREGTSTLMEFVLLHALSMAEEPDPQTWLRALEDGNQRRMRVTRKLAATVMATIVGLATVYIADCIASGKGRSGLVVLGVIGVLILWSAGIAGARRLRWEHRLGASPSRDPVMRMIAPIVRWPAVVKLTFAGDASQGVSLLGEATTAAGFGAVWVAAASVLSFLSLRDFVALSLLPTIAVLGLMAGVIVVSYLRFEAYVKAVGGSLNQFLRFARHQDLDRSLRSHALSVRARTREFDAQFERVDALRNARSG